MTATLVPPPQGVEGALRQAVRAYEGAKQHPRTIEPADALHDYAKAAGINLDEADLRVQYAQNQLKASRATLYRALAAVGLDKDDADTLLGQVSGYHCTACISAQAA